MVGVGVPSPAPSPLRSRARTRLGVLHLTTGFMPAQGTTRATRHTTGTTPVRWQPRMTRTRPQPAWQPPRRPRPPCSPRPCPTPVRQQLPPRQRRPPPAPPPPQRRARRRRCRRRPRARLIRRCRCPPPPRRRRRAARPPRPPRPTPRPRQPRRQLPPPRRAARLRLRRHRSPLPRPSPWSSRSVSSTTQGPIWLSQGPDCACRHAAHSRPCYWATSACSFPPTDTTPGATSRAARDGKDAWRIYRVGCSDALLDGAGLP